MYKIKFKELVKKINMNSSPKNKTLGYLLTLSLFSFLTLLLPTASQAASAYISPATGMITNKNFKVSIYVESTITEPEISGAQVKITYPASVTVSSITDGDFNSYVEKNNNAATRTISIKAVNNAGGYMSGKVKLGSISFDAVDKTGQVQLQITSDSSMTGAGGEQLLTETINGVYTLDVSDAAAVATVTASPVATDTTATTAKVPKTGINHSVDLLVYMVLSIGLIGLGAVSFKKYILANTK